MSHSLIAHFPLSYMMMTCLKINSVLESANSGSFHDPAGKDCQLTLPPIFPLPFDSRCPWVLAERTAAPLPASLPLGRPGDEDLSPEVGVEGTGSGSRAFKRNGLTPHSLPSPSSRREEDAGEPASA